MADVTSHGVPHGVTVQIEVKGQEPHVWPREMVEIAPHAVVVGDTHKVRSYPYVSMVRRAPGVIDFTGPVEDFTLRPGPPEEDDDGSD